MTYNFYLTAANAKRKDSALTGLAAGTLQVQDLAHIDTELTAIVTSDPQGWLDALEGVRRGTSNGLDAQSRENRRSAYEHGGESHLSDLFAAATNRKVQGSGTHPASYFRHPGKRQTESWANLTSLLGSGPVFAISA